MPTPSRTSAGAQRLPASKEETRLRHHADGAGVDRAQRLPASKEETREEKLLHFLTICHAQRLPASKEETRRLSPRYVAWSSVCSTPSGIKGRNARNGRRFQQLDQLCSTPSGIKGRNAPRTRWYRLARTTMLNAFRHQRKKRFRNPKPPSTVSGCSTPSGIKGRNARRRRGVSTTLRYAQRLPASKEETLETLVNSPEGQEIMLNAFRHQRKKRHTRTGKEDGGKKCSTPSGIKGRNARNGREAKNGDKICSTPSGIKGRNAIAVSNSATRLGHAQRLPASKEETPSRFRLRSVVVSMLNAFRHQRKKRSRLPCHVSSGGVMLNAFRHQRKKRKPERRVLSSFPICSTPSGIKGRNAGTTGLCLTLLIYAQRLPASKEETRSGAKQLSDLRHMLNAFRHQRKKRTQNRQQSILRNKMLNAFRHQRKKRIRCIVHDQLHTGLCSTPSGIKGRNARLSRRLPAAIPHAQRLPASKEETRRVLRTSDRGADMLNAFRHQRKKRDHGHAAGECQE